MLVLGQSEAVAVNAWRLLRTRDLCNSPFWQGTTVPEFKRDNWRAETLLLPIRVPGKRRNNVRHVFLRCLWKFFVIMRRNLFDKDAHFLSNCKFFCFCLKSTVNIIDF